MVSGGWMVSDLAACGGGGGGGGGVPERDALTLTAADQPAGRRPSCVVDAAVGV